MEEPTTTCESCGRALYEKDGPVCPECVKAQRAAERAEAKDKKADAGSSTSEPETGAKTEAVATSSKG